MTGWRCAIMALLALCLQAHAQAQNRPDRPVTIVVAAAAGGPIDVFTLVIAERISAHLKQRVLVENVAGSGGIMGGQRVAKAAPDGYTLLLGTLATHANPQLLGSKPPYDPIADFAPIALIAEIPLVLVARKDFPADSFERFIAYAKANQKGMSFGSAGVGSASHLGCVMFQRAVGIDVAHLAYRGTAPAMQDLIAGRLDFLCELAVTAVPNIRAGTIKSLANLSGRRLAALPDLPTVAEKGYPSVEISTWTGLFAPKGAPAPIIARLNAATVAAMNGPGLNEQLNEVAATLVAPDRRSPDYLGRFVRDEVHKWGDAIRTSGALP